MRTPLNLARRPFRNERLPTIVLAVACVLLALLTVRHAFLARSLLPGGSGDAQALLAKLEGRLGAMRRESLELRQATASADKVKEWQVVRQIVDRRAFSWTALLAALERALPPGVRLRSVAPVVRSGRIEISLTATGRSVEDALALPTALQAQGQFEGAFLDNYGERSGEVDISCKVRYVGGSVPAVAEAP